MFIKKIHIALFILCFPLLSKADNGIINSSLLSDFFEKLYCLETTNKGKINIVHIGDSHIQADFFTGAVRNQLQSIFGNAGYGFTFPYSLANTNGTGLISYKSNIDWNFSRNISSNSTTTGLAGIALFTLADDFTIYISVKKPYFFSIIKLIYDDTLPPFYAGSVNYKTSYQETYKIYKAKKGDSINKLSKRYRVSAKTIKKINGLKSNNIHPGCQIKIPYKKRTYEIPKNGLDSIFRVDNNSHMSVFSSDILLSDACIVPADRNRKFKLDGIILENNNHGILYHSIGVNGAKYSDYNKNELFFEQLKCLNPDLIIVSLGTNESFGKISSSQFRDQVLAFVENVRKFNKEAVLMIMTPLPSLLKNKNINNYIKEYSDEILNLNYVPIWDCLEKMGGIYAPYLTSSQGIIAKDKIHYTKEGYEKQADLFVADFLREYRIFKRGKF